MNKPITISKKSNVSDAIRELRNKKISRLLVSDDNKCNSIITEKDIGLFLLTDNTERTLEQIPVSEIMKPLRSISASTSIRECAKNLIENSIGSLAIQSNGAIDGLITKTDLTKFFAENYSGKKIVGEYATSFSVIIELHVLPSEISNLLIFLFLNSLIISETFDSLEIVIGLFIID
jgi:predicted transcriptional regulator